MPGNIQNASPSGVMPYALCTNFSESREYVQLQAQYHDGTADRTQLAQTSRRSFKIAQRLTTARAIALKAFESINTRGGGRFATFSGDLLN